MESSTISEKGLKESACMSTQYKTTKIHVSFGMNSAPPPNNDK